MAWPRNLSIVTQDGKSNEVLQRIFTLIKSSFRGKERKAKKKEKKQVRFVSPPLELQNL